MAITKEILDELLKDYQKPEDLLGQSGLLQQLSKALIERVNLPKSASAAVHRPSAEEFARLRLVEGTQGCGGRA